MIYFVILFLLLVLSIRYDINGKTAYRDQWYMAVIVILILVAGLRFRLGVDTINYIYMFYHDFPMISDISIDTFLSSDQPPLWILLNSIIKSLNGKFFFVQLVQATVLNVLMLKYFKKHSSYPFVCATLYFLWRYQWYSMVVMKAAIALSIILFANDYFLKKKYVKGVFLILIATGFHQSSIVLMITPFLTFLRFNRIGVVFLVSAFFFGAFLQSKLGDVFVLFDAAEGLSNKLDSYMDNDEFMTQNHNLNYFMLQVYPFIIYPVLSLVYLKRNCKESQILTLEPILMMALLFLMMQFSIYVMYRFTYIYTPYYILFFVHFFMEFSKNSFKLSKPLAYVRTFTIVFPLLFSIAYISPLTKVDFYPYSSVIEKSIDKGREKFYTKLLRYNLNMEEY